MEFHWDQMKADLNWKKHGVDFADAVGVFEDDWALTLKDEVVSGEKRCATVGTDFLGSVIVVIYTYRDENIRIISARPATRTERGNYDERRI
jgi:uncharacterized DUF497 family protein